MSEGELKKFYNSKAWKEYRVRFIQDRIKEKGAFCEMCGKILMDSSNIEVHHKKELTEENYKDVNISLNPDNTMMICHICHNKQHKRWQYRRKTKREPGKVYIVYGPPMSGKTTYVIDNMKPGDLVIDLDKIYEALSMCSIYSKPKELKANVFNVRDALIEDIKNRRGRWRCAWIIGGYPKKHIREKLRQELNAELVNMDVSKEECMKRIEECKDDRGTKHKELWMSYIDEWFDDYRE